MNKVRIMVVTGVANVYPTGQEGRFLTLKAGQDTEVTVGEKPEPKTDLPARVAEDLGAPAVGVATGEAFGSRDGTLNIAVKEGAAVLRVYEGSEFSETHLAADGHAIVTITESNKVTCALYPPEAAPKG